MNYFQGAANEEDNVIKLNQVAYLCTLNVSMKSKATQTLYKTMSLTSLALKYYVFLKVYPPEARHMVI